MSWKKTLPFFAWQTIRYAQSINHFFQMWSYYKDWKTFLKPERNSIVDGLPWLNFIVIDFLKKNLHTEDEVFEFGGGGSTLFFCKNVAAVTTVEHDMEWFGLLTKVIQEKGYTNWKGFFVEPDVVSENISRNREDPSDFMSGGKGLEQLSFEKYARTINQFPLNYFDVILVDGRARPSCIQQSIPHLKPGGYMIIDNTEREYYLRYLSNDISGNFSLTLEVLGPVPFAADFSKSTIITKNRDSSADPSTHRD